MKIQLILPKTLGPAQTAVEQAKKELEIAKKTFDKLESKIKLVCPKCEHQQDIGATVYIQTHWMDDEVYNQHWRPGEGNYRCHSCEEVIRLYDQPHVVALKDSFYNIHNTY